MKFIHALTHGNPAKKVTVLHEGSVLAEGSLAEVQADEKVVEVYLDVDGAPTLAADAAALPPEGARPGLGDPAPGRASRPPRRCSRPSR